MRLLALVLTVLLMSPATALAQEFYRLYEQGVGAFPSLGQEVGGRRGRGHAG